MTSGIQDPPRRETPADGRSLDGIPRRIRKALVPRRD